MYLRILLLTLSCLLIAVNIYAQETDRDYYDKANCSLWEYNDYTKALQNYQYLVKHFPDSKYCIEAYNKIGVIYDSMHQDRLAINAYRGTYYDHNGNIREQKQSFYNSIAPEIVSFNRLINLYEKTKNYDSALYFFYVRDSVFKVAVCVLNENENDMIEITHYTDLLLKVNRIREAELKLISALQVPEYERLAAIELRKIFSEHENIAELKSNIEIAVNNYVLDTAYDKDSEAQHVWISCCTNFLGRKWCYNYRFLPENTKNNIYHMAQKGKLSEKENTIAVLKTLPLYQLIQDL